MNQYLSKITDELKKAIEDTIRKDLREEAFKILSFGSENDRNEFLEAYNNDKGNICCLILDYAKRDLVKQGIMEQKDTDGFGRFPFE